MRQTTYYRLLTTHYLLQIVEIKAEWLVEIAPHYYKKKDIADDSGKKLPKAVGKAAAS